MEKKHPSFGMVSFSRCYGTNRRLFQSHVKNMTTVRLRIKQASVKHSLHQDHTYGEESLIEVELSPAQFAELLTSMNVGDGVPCTINYVNEKKLKTCQKKR
jgi:hypothetical protein